MTKDDNLRKECFEKKFYSFGTVKIFEKRVSDYGRKLKAITFLGFLPPIILGAFIASFSLESLLLKKILIPACGLLSTIQPVVSLWSLISKWEDKYAYAIGSVKANTRLANEFESLLKKDPKDIESELDHLAENYKRQEVEDTVQDISDKEKRYAMRHALFQFKCPCRTCERVPVTLTPTNCDTCGNY